MKENGYSTLCSLDIPTHFAGKITGLGYRGVDLPIEVRYLVSTDVYINHKCVYSIPVHNSQKTSNCRFQMQNTDIHKLCVDSMINRLGNHTVNN